MTGLRLGLPRPQLAWDGGVPRDAGVDDVYFSAADGLAEARAVFLAGCGLPDAWSERERFVVGELGFGSGLNVLALWELWDRAKPAGARLHVVSVEGAPMSADEAKTAHAPWPELAERAAKLRAAWPPAVKGVHHRRLAEDVSLTLALLPVDEALDQLELTADAWFLDGFAPAKNPDMWTPDVLARIGALTRPGGRVGTYTVAGAVRRGLQAAGFTVDKRPGFGSKRDRLEAVKQTDPAPSRRAPTRPRAALSQPAHVLIIGAGSAGASVARALLARGVRVEALCADAAPAAGASGNPAGLIMPRLDLDDRPLARFHRTAYAHALAAYDGSHAFRTTGAQRLATDDVEAAKHRALHGAGALPPAMMTLDDEASLAFPHAGVLEPIAQVQAWLARAAVTTRFKAIGLERVTAGWRVTAEDGRTAQGDAVVLASGPAIAAFEHTAWLPVRPSRGQVSWAAFAGEAPPVTAFGGYAAPLDDQKLLFGATYAPWDGEPIAPSPDDDRSNLAMLARHAPGLAQAVNADALQGRASLRATTPDRAPYCGPVPDADAFRERFAGLAHGRMDVDAAPAPLQDAMFVLGGLGSRGLVWAPLLGEAMAADICGEPSVLEREAAEALHPARTLERALKKRR